LIDADYSQIELRLLAHIAGDTAMIDSFLSGEDIHAMTAAKVFGVALEDVTPDLRKKAKAVNFGIMYGIGEYSLSEDLGISRAQAKEYIESYFEKFPQIRAYLDRVQREASDNGYVTTLFGRRRYIPELSSSNKMVRSFGERVAMNSPIQGTAADIIKVAMIRTDRELQRNGLDARQILQVHDELLIECHRECAEEVKALLISCMEQAVSYSVPMSVEANVGATWYDAK
jgi:DNA polymerase-1